MAIIITKTAINKKVSVRRLSGNKFAYSVIIGEAIFETTNESNVYMFAYGFVGWDFLGTANTKREFIDIVASWFND